jgi:hypothetical protein
VPTDDTEDCRARQGLALISASWLSLREADTDALLLARQLTNELTEAGDRGINGLTSAAVALLDAVHELAGPEVANAALERAGAPGLQHRLGPPE